MRTALVCMLALAYMTCTFAENRYMIIGNKQLIKGSPYTLSIKLNEADSDTRVNAKIQVKSSWDQPYETIAEDNINIPSRRDDPTILNLDVPSTFEGYQARLMVNGTGSVDFGAVESLTVAGQSSTRVLIQTDKAMYKPSDIVRYRVVAVDERLIPLAGPYEVLILDNNQNRIAQILDKELADNEGYIEGQITLSEQPPMGDWTIKVTINDEDHTKSFTVEEYVLPKYEVTIEMGRSFHALEFGDITGNIMAKYTFGQGVEGTADLTITPQGGRGYNYFVDDEDIMMDEPMYRGPPGPPGRPGRPGSGSIRGINRRVQADGTGRFPFTITMNELKDMMFDSEENIDLSQLEGQSFQLDVTVTESLTGKALTASESIKIEQHRMEVKILDNTPKTYKSGMPFVAYIKLTQADGSLPGSEDLVDSENGRRVITLHQSYQANPEDDDGRVNMQNTYEENANFEINDQGIAVCQLTIPTDTTQFTLTAKYTIIGTNFDGRTTEEEISSRSYTVNKYLSRDGGSIQITMDAEDKILRADQTYTFNVESSVDMRSANYYIVVKERVIASGRVFTPGNVRTSDSFEFTFGSTVATSAKIAVIAVTTDDEVLVDASVLNVEAELPNHVEAEFTSATREPGESVGLNIQAAPNSFIGVLAVDRSVQLLKSGNDITHDSLINQVGDNQDGGGVYFDIMPRCFRCWWPYYPGGTDAHSALNNLGLITITDAVIHQEEPDYRDRPDYWGPVFDEEMRAPVGVPGAPGADGGGVAGPEGQPGPGGPGADENVYYMEDGLAQAGPPPRVGGGGDAAYDGMAERGPDGDDGADGEEGGNDSVATPRVRQIFPETWLWSDQQVGSNGRTELRDLTVPDTLTSWTANVLAVHRTEGVGVPQNAAMLTVFTPFFVTLDLPYSVVRGEVANLKVNIFNYESNDQVITVTLDESAHFMVMDNLDDEPRFRTAQRVITIPSETADQVVFWIKTTSLGQVNINVQATSPLTADALQRQLLVEPEGVPDSYTRTVLVDLTESNDFIKTLNIELPDTLVAGSQYYEMSVMGDVMSKLINNMGHLIKMPYGCGEQNMINFVPNILVLEYFQHTGLGSDSQHANALNFMEIGYQREMTYQHTDGSYSAFGNSDPEGSTWLTAFVVRSFKRAEPFINVDQEALGNAVRFLISKQMGNGQVEELGTVLHGELKGNSFHGAALTAYVLEAFCRVRTMNSGNLRIEGAIESAVEYLRRIEIENRDDTYTLAIVTSAFQCLDDSYADTLLRELNSRAVDEDSSKYWPEAVSDSPTTEPRHYGHYSHPSFEVEQTAYGLLANLYDGRPIGEVIPILGWLTKQQNSMGGFRSTQDTILALSAFAEYAKNVYGGSTSQDVAIQVSLQAKLENSLDNLDSYSFDVVTIDNTLLLQQYQLPDNSEQVILTASGNGIATVQLAVRYHMNVRDTSPDVFIHVDSDLPNINDLQIINVDACTRWTSDSDSGMANIDIMPISGYLPITTGLRERHAGMMRYEVDQTTHQLNTYWNEFPRGQDVCVHVQLERQFDVEEVQPARAESYAYYSPNKRSVASYLPLSLRTNNTVVPDNCLLCPECCIPVGAYTPRPRPPSGNGSGVVQVSAALVLSLLAAIMMM